MPKSWLFKGEPESIDKTITVEAAKLSDTYLVKGEVVILADINNDDTIFIGNETIQSFPLMAGASLSFKEINLADIYAKSNSGNQTLHIIFGSQ